MDLEREILRLKRIIDSASVNDTGGEVFELAKAYCSDALHFLKKGNEWNALEAYAIAWAYVDALLHLGLVEVEDRAVFTVE